MNRKLVTLGEIMLRLSTPDFKRFVQADTFDVTYGGAEANVAAAWCNFGLSGTFITKVPDNAIGQAAINHLRRYGVNTQFIVRGGERIGVYFLEHGNSLRPSHVIYDRSSTAISDADIAEFNLEEIFKDAEWFHITGITPALGDKAAALTEAVLKYAKAKRITTSIDLNYRKKLWSRQKSREVMNRLLPYIDVCIGVEDIVDTAPVATNSATNVADKRFSLDLYKSACKNMMDKFGFKIVATTLRESHSASENSVSALAFDGQQMYHCKKYKTGIVDRIGSGDSFASGFIYGLVTGMSVLDAAEFGVAACALKHTIPGDLNHASLSEVFNLMKGDENGNVQR